MIFQLTLVTHEPRSLPAIFRRCALPFDLSPLHGHCIISNGFTGVNGRVSVPGDASLTGALFFLSQPGGEEKALLSYLGTVVMQWMLLAMYVRD